MKQKSQNAMRYRDIRLWCDVTDVNHTELALAHDDGEHGVTLAKVTRCYAGNFSQSNPGSGSRNS